MDNIITTLTIVIIPLIFAITLHEAAHGFVAYHLGDKTAYYAGRVTLNPLKHIDLIGTIILPIIFIVLNTGFMFGWAKPVPINWYNFKNPLRDSAYTAAAGPISNFIMAIFWLGIAMTGIPILVAMGKFGIAINLMLGILNLIPIPPLDGSRVVAALLPQNAALTYMKIEPYGFIILILLLFSGLLFAVLEPIYTAVNNLFLSMLS